MELNDDTLQILKNFSGINQNIMIRSGNILRSISEARNVLARADITNEFPKDFGVYDLNEFIGVLSLVDKPKLNFNDEHVIISDSVGRSKIKYFYSAEDVLTTSEKDITMPECDIKFTLDSATLDKIKRAASTLGHDEVSIKPGNGSITLSVVDNQNSTSNAFDIDVAGEYQDGVDFNFILGISNLKIIPGDYEVAISSKLISQFSHKEVNIKYWIALEKTSKYGV
jgi:hypothetical protein